MPSTFEEDEERISKLSPCTIVSAFSSSKTQPPAFGLTTEQLTEICKLPSDEFSKIMLDAMHSYYLTLPCPEILVPLRAENTWKMDILVRGDAAKTVNPMLHVKFTLWDESRGASFGSPSSSINVSVKSPLYIFEGSIDAITTVGALGMASIPDAFGRGSFYLSPKPASNDTSAKKNLAAISALQFKAYKILVHDATLAEGLGVMQRVKASQNKADGLPAFGTIAVTLLSTPNARGKGVRMHFLSVCGACRSMGLCQAGHKELKSMKRCSSYCKRYYCNRKCQKEDWVHHKLECKGKTRVKAKM